MALELESFQGPIITGGVGGSAMLIIRWPETQDRRDGGREAISNVVIKYFQACLKSTLGLMLITN